MDNFNYDGIIWRKTTKGYWINKIHGLQHIYVWQNHFQATVDTTEDLIHHVNDDKSDNRIENLQLMTRGEHTILHRTGCNHSAEAKVKMSRAKTGKITGENNPMFGKHRFGSDNPFYGKHHSDETKQKLIGNKYGLGNKSNLGKHHSDESKQKMSSSRKGKPWTEARRNAQKKMSETIKQR